MLILNGGGAGEKIKQSYQLFARKVGDGKVLYVPLAWENGPMESCIDWFKSEMSPYGITNIDGVLSASEITADKLKNYAGVFIGGGNTFKLLKQLKESCAFDTLKDFLNDGGVIMGGSAGSLIFGRTIDSCKDDGLGIKSACDVNYVNLKDTTGFNLLNGYDLFVHYKKVEAQNELTKQRIDRLLSEGHKLICLPEESSLVVENGEFSIIGNGQVEIFTDSLQSVTSLSQSHIQL